MTTTRGRDWFGLSTMQRERFPLLLLIMLIGSDLLMISLHVRMILFGGDITRHIDNDDGHAEILQMIKWLWIVGLIIVAAMIARRWILLTAAPIFTALLLTDTLSIHERLGERTVDLLGLQPAFGLRAVDFGELIVVGVGAAITLPALLIGWWRARGDDRHDLSRIIQILALVFVVGVVFDPLHMLLKRPHGTLDPMVLLEDGGEMIAASLLVAFCFAIALRRRRVPREVEADARLDDQTSTHVPAPADSTERAS